MLPARRSRSSRRSPSSRRRCAPSTRWSRAGASGRLQHEPTTRRTSERARWRATSTSVRSWRSSRTRLPGDAVQTCGAGNFTVWAHRFAEFTQFGTQACPRSGSMGYGLPAAVAAQLIHPERVVVCFTGDGDFVMSSPELRNRGPVRPADRRAPGEQRDVRDDPHAPERQFPGRVVGTDLENPDFPALARAYGAHGERVERTEDFEAAFDRASPREGRRCSSCRSIRSEISPRVRLSELAGTAHEPRGDPRRRPRPSRSRTSRTVCSPGASCTSPGSWRSTETADSSAATTSSHRRGQIFENMRAVLAAGGCGFEDVVKVTVFLTDIDDRPLINPVRQGVFGASRPALDPRRGSAPCRSRAPRSRSSASHWCRERRSRNQRVHHPGRARPGRRRAARGTDARRQATSSTPPGSARRTARGSTPTTSSERNATAVQRLLDAGAVIVGKTHLPEFAWSVLGQSEWYDTCHNPTHPGQDDGRVVVRLGGRPCRRSLRARARLGHGLLHPPALGHLRGRRAQVAVGVDLHGWCVPARADARHGRPDGAQRRGRRAHVVGAHASDRCPSRGWRADASGSFGSHPGSATGGRPSAATPPRRWVADLERLGARVVEARIPDADREHVAAVPARGAAVARGDLSEPRRRVRRASCRRSSAPRSARRRRRSRRRTARSRSGGGSSPRSTSTSVPATRSSCLPEDADELGGPAPAHVVPALDEPHGLGRSGDLRTCTRRAARRAVLAAGLAWERGWGGSRARLSASRVDSQAKARR